MTCVAGGWSDEVMRSAVGMPYYDVQSWKRLDPILVEEGGGEELGRLKNMGVYEYSTPEPEEAQRDVGGKTVQIKWVQINQGPEVRPEVRCRHVPQKLGGRREVGRDAWKYLPSLNVAKMLSVAVEQDEVIMLLHVKGARCPVRIPSLGTGAQARLKKTMSPPPSPDMGTLKDNIVGGGVQGKRAPPIGLKERSSWPYGGCGPCGRRLVKCGCSTRWGRSTT